MCHHETPGGRAFPLGIKLENKAGSAAPGLSQFDSIIQNFAVWYLRNES